MSNAREMFCVAPITVLIFPELDVVNVGCVSVSGGDEKHTAAHWSVVDRLSEDSSEGRCAIS